MYRTNRKATTSIRGVDAIEGETIEQKVRRIVNNKEPITDGAPIVYTERKEGVLPQYDIRADRWDIALGAMDKVTQAKEHKRTMKVVKDDGKPEPSQANSGTDASASITGT
jgi:hypothetical protein